MSRRSRSRRSSNHPRNPAAEDDPPRRAAAATLIVFLVALALHGAVWMQYRQDPFHATLVSDALSYDEWARRLATDGLAAEPVFHQSPLFPILLGWIYGLVAPASRAGAAIGLQVLLLSAAIALLVPLGRVYFRSTMAGVAAAAVALLHGPLPFHSMKLLPVPLALFTQVLALLLLGAARHAGSPWIALACGAACGLAAIARSETLLFLPVALLALWLGDSAPGAGQQPGRFRVLGACLAGMLVVIAPVTLHNLRRGDRVPVASSAGENLFIGNQREATGGHAPLDPRAGDLFSQRALARILAEEAAGAELRPSQVSAYWRGRAVREIRDSPGRWLRLELRKLGLMLHPGDPADIYSFPLERNRYLRALHLTPLSALALWLLGGAGLVTALRANRRRVWPLAAMIALHGVVLLAFFVSTRLRLPLLLFLTPFAGYAVASAIRLWRAGRARPALALGALVVVLVSIHGSYLLAPSPREVVRLASVLSMQGRLDDSLAVLEGEVGRPDADALALDQAGWVHQKRGDLEPARGSYLRALDAGLPPARAAQTRSRLAGVHERLGETDLAAAMHDQAVAGAPGSGGGWYERGMFRLRQGDRAGALSDLRRAAELAPDWPPPRQALRSLQAGPA